MNQLAMLKQFAAGVETLQQMIPELKARLSTAETPLLTEQQIQELLASGATVRLIEESTNRTNDKLTQLLSEISLQKTATVQMKEMPAAVKEIRSDMTQVIKLLSPQSARSPKFRSRKRMIALTTIICASLLCSTTFLIYTHRLRNHNQELQAQNDQLIQQVTLINNAYERLSPKKQKEFLEWVNQSSTSTNAQTP